MLARLRKKIEATFAAIPPVAWLTTKKRIARIVVTRRILRNNILRASLLFGTWPLALALGFAVHALMFFASTVPGLQIWGPLNRWLAVVVAMTVWGEALTRAHFRWLRSQRVKAKRAARRAL